MKVPFVDLSAQYETIKDEMDAAISGIIRQSAFIGGKAVASFEQAFAAYSGQSHCISCANGTDALEIALEAFGLGAGDEVLVPAYTWVSTANAVCRTGAKPVLVDVHSDRYTLDIESLKQQITSNTKAITPVHLYGLPADMEEIMALAGEHNLYVLEDCAQAHGAEINGRKVGTFGHMAAFSFYPGKNLGAYGDAGAMITNDDALADKARMIARLGQRKKHDHRMVGRNSRLDGLQAAVLETKLKYLDQWITGRNRVANWYNEALADLDIKSPSVPDGYQHVYHLYVVQVEQRDALQIHLKENGITALIHYPKPLNQLDVFEVHGEYPVSDAMANRILSLPIYPELTHEQVLYVANCIRDFYNQ